MYVLLLLFRFLRLYQLLLETLLFVDSCTHSVETQFRQLYLYDEQHNRVYHDEEKVSPENH